MTARLSFLRQAAPSFRQVAHVLLYQYRRRSVVAMALMVSQAFFYNAIFFTYALVLTRFHGVAEGRVALYIFPFALGNVLGPLLLGPLFDRVGRLLGRFEVAPFFLQLVGGFLATACTLGLLAVGALPPSTEPSLVISASITVLLSGLSVMGAVQDAISGHPVTAAGRAAEVALLSAGLLAGVILGLKVGIAFSLELDPAEPVAAESGT